MSFGHFAGGFGEAFTQTLMARQNQKRQDEMAKLQGKLLELQIKGGERTLEGQEKVSDMMAGNQLGQFQIQPDQSGLGEFQTSAVPGPDGRMQTPRFQPGGEARNVPPVQQGMDMQPMSLTEMLADPQGQMALVQAGMLDIGDLVGGPGRSNATLDMMAAAGIDPKSPEGRELIEAKIGGAPDDFLQKALLQIQVGQETERLAKAKEERTVREKTEHQRVEGTKLDAKTDFRHAREAFELQKELENSALAAGVPYGEFLTELAGGKTAVLGALGFDVTMQRDLIVKRKRLEKLFADGTLNALDRFTGTGAVGRDKFRELQKATPSMLVPSQTNSLLFADRLEAMLDAASIDKIDIDERADIESFIKELRNYTPANPAGKVDGPAAVAEATDFANKSLQELESIDLESFGSEQLAALERRIQELKGQ